MDVQTLELRLGYPRFPITRPFGRNADPPAPAAPGRGRSPAGPGDSGAAASVSRQAWLYAYTAVSIITGLGALLWSTVSVPVLPAIDPGLTGTALGGADGGMLLWIAFGLIGSLRVLPVPGSSAVWTFHFPFIAAAMILGGPTAGAWVGVLSTIERRELESQPWYGTLANHAVIACAAVVGGLTVLVLRSLLADTGTDPGVAGLVAAGTGTLVLALISNGVAAGTIMLRENLSPVSVIDILLRSLGPITVAEVGIAWVFVTLFATTGWWAPLALSLIVLLVWPGEGVEFIDPLTRLPRDRMFRRELESLLVRTKRGLATGGLLVLLDLDGFGVLNKDHGQHIGDEVLAEIGERIRRDIRTTDFAGRRGGDEFAAFYSGVSDLVSARKIAERLEASIRRDISTSAGAVHVGVSIGALLVRPAADLPSAATLMEWADAEVQIVKKAQKAGRSKTGIRFHRYGSRDAGSRGEPSSSPADPPGAADHDVASPFDQATRLMALTVLVVLAAFALSRVMPA